MQPLDRRSFLHLTASGAIAAASLGTARAQDPCGSVSFIDVPLEVVPMPRDIAFVVSLRGVNLTLRAHYWYHAPAMAAGKRMPAIVEFNPYRRRDGMLYVDSMMYPWFAYNEYLCFRVDLPGSGDSDGVITDEYTDEELASCVQTIEQIAALPFCDGNVGMMGKSWSAINSLMVAARDDCPAALKAIVFCCGTDDRFNDDVHYMGGAMMYDQPSWASSMWGWLPMPPDPLVVGAQWKQMWRTRIASLDFWFSKWAAHQVRDAYWKTTSVRDYYDRVKVPVFAISGWQDGYKNPAERIVRELRSLGKEAAGIIGPWGHKYPFDGFPGPRVDWLRYVVTHWWDRWLKGAAVQSATAWPELAIWLGESREPRSVPDYIERGSWVAENYDWPTRAQPLSLHLTDRNELSPGPAPQRQSYSLPMSRLTGTAMLETSSWGECENDDLPRDQSQTDRRSLYFDSATLDRDVSCFGYPEVTLRVQCSAPSAALAVRLCEVSPSGRSHLVTYRFWNLAYRDGELGGPQPLPHGPFSVKIPLNVMGHTFKRGWKIRLSISPTYVPTMWRMPGQGDIAVHAGGDAHSALVLPVRVPREQDVRAAQLLGQPTTAYVNPEQYAPIARTLREATNRRIARASDGGGTSGVEVHKLMDAGSYVYGGILKSLLVDSTATETFVTAAGDPMSAVMTTRYESKLERGDWRVRAVTTTRVWSERGPSSPMFRYTADVETFDGDELFENRHVEGMITRSWV